MMGISIERVRGIGRRHDLPSVRIGGRYYFDLDMVMDHMSNPKLKSYMKRKNDHEGILASLKKENEVLREKVEQLENKLESIKNHFWDIVQ